MIRTEQLVKTYNKGTTNAVRGVSLNIAKGELFGLIGPDGAGKTSILRMLATLLIPDSGTAEVNGFDTVRDYKQIRNCIGYMPGRFSLYPDLTVAENLRFFATLFNTTVEENYHLVKDIYIQIEPFRERPAGKLSGGMKQKLALCCALIHKPEVLLLDEPTTGVDAVSRKEFWEMLRRLREMGITILVSTPYMDEANLCQRIALMQEGQLLSVDTPSNIVATYDVPLYGATATNMNKLLTDLRSTAGIDSCYAFGNSHHITLANERTAESIENELKGKGHDKVRVELIKPGIEDSFIRFMNRKTNA